MKRYITSSKSYNKSKFNQSLYDALQGKISGLRYVDSYGLGDDYMFHVQIFLRNTDYDIEIYIDDLPKSSLSNQDKLAKAVSKIVLNSIDRKYLDDSDHLQ